jgi:arylsulfatase
MVVAWPGHIVDPGGVRSQYQHVIDVMPTILQAAGLPVPKSVDGVAQQRLDGVSFAPTFENAKAPGRATQYFEMHGNRAIYDNGWIAAQRSGLLPWAYALEKDAGPLPWELYHLSEDYSESHDVAATNAAKLQQMEALFDREAETNHVYPIDPRIAGRQHPNPPPPGGRAFYTFYPGASHLYDALAPATRNRSHTFTAYVTIPAAGASGVIVAEGGDSSGYSLYLQNGHPAYAYNYFRRERTSIVATDPLPPGRSVIELRFVYDGGGLGKGANVILTVNGKKAGEARLARTVPRAYSFEETFDVGEDSATPVGPYQSPFPFTGVLEKLELRSEPAPSLTAAERTTETKTAQAIADAKD